MFACMSGFMRVRVYAHVPIQVCRSVRMYVCYLSMYVCMHVWPYPCMYLCPGMYEGMCLCMNYLRIVYVSRYVTYLGR